MKITITTSTPAPDELGPALKALASGASEGALPEPPGDPAAGITLEIRGGDGLGELLRGVLALGARLSLHRVVVETADGRLEIPTDLPEEILERFVARVKELDTRDLSIELN